VSDALESPDLADHRFSLGFPDVVESPDLADHRFAHASASDFPMRWNRQIWPITASLTLQPRISR